MTDRTWHRCRYWWDTGTEVLADLLLALLLIAWQLALLVVYTAMALAEPVVGMVLSLFAFASFWVAILFGFVFKMPFAHRWQVLGASIACLLLYGAYLGLMRLIARGLR